MIEFFTIIFNTFRRRKTLFIFLLLAVMGLSAFLAIRLKFVEDIYKVVPADEKVEKFTTALQHSAFSDQLIMYITPEDKSGPDNVDVLISFAERLEDSLFSSFYPEYLKKIRIRTDDSLFFEVYDEIYEFLPLFLDKGDYPDLERMTDPKNVEGKIHSAYKSLLSPAGFAMREFILKDPLGMTSLVTKKIQDLQVDESYSIYNGYIFSSDRRYLMVFLTPAHPSTETSQNSVLMERLDHLIASISEDLNGKVSAEYFGSAAISVSNARQIKKDITLTMSLAIAVLTIFILLYFRHRFYFLAIFFPAILGGGLSMAILYLIRSEVSAISLGFGAVMLGITIDYAMHFLNDLREAADPRKVIRDMAIPISMSSLTTAGAFFSLLLVRSDAIADLGLFAGFSVLGAAFFTLVILPQIPAGKKNTANERRSGFLFMDRFSRIPLEKNKTLILIILGLTVFFFFTSKRTSFESDMTRMSYMDQRLTRAEKTLDTISRFTLRSVFLLSSGKDMEEALRKNERLVEKVNSLKKDGIVQKSSGIYGFLPSDSLQRERINLWNHFWSNGRSDSVVRAVQNTAAELGIKPTAFGSFYELIQGDFTAVEPGELDKITSALLTPYINEDSLMTTITTVLKVRQEDKPSLYQALGDEEEYFVFDKQFLTSTFMDVLKNDFDRLVMFSLLLVFVIMLVIFGRIELTAVTFIPMFLSWIWTLGIMGLLGIKLNIFNIIITSFVFGLGIDYSIFIMQGMLQEYKYGTSRLPTFRVSILLAAMTTLIGIGALIFGKHPALKSIAVTAIIGIVSVWLITWVIEPVLFRWIVYHKGKRRSKPVTLVDLSFSLLSLLIWVSGSVIFTIIALLLFTWVPTRWNSKKWLHYGLMMASRFLIYSNFLTPKRIFNDAGKNWKKPAIIISNHQSHVDLAVILMQHPRLIVLTNDRVQRNPVYGRLARLSDYFPVSDGVEGLLPRLRKYIRKGYSVLVFPEGTRSADGSIQRFHKGAFYLAKKLNMDIQPIIIHGTGHCMGKGELFLKTGVLHIRFLPRLLPADIPEEENLVTISRYFTRLYREKYEEIVRMEETPRYFREKLIKNYLYKGPVLEWYLKVKIRMEKDYEVFHRHMPQNGHITDIGCGYGFMDYMLMFLSKGRKITGFDYDEEKIEVAGHCPAKNDRLEFYATDVMKTDLPESDAFIISDVLHYMPEDEQEKLIRRCIDKLASGGVLMIRDADREMGKEHFRTRLSEFFSTRIGFNRTITADRKLYFTSGKRILNIMNENGMDTEIIKESRTMSNIIFVSRKRSRREG